MNQEVSATEGGRDWGAIIPSFLDDYGLDPYEMRVYIRLARRAGMGGPMLGINQQNGFFLPDERSLA